MDRDQFVLTFREHLGSVSKYLARRVDKSDIEDLAGEIFEIAWRKKEACPEGLELAWLYRISGYVVANYRRKASRKIVFLPLFDSDQSAPSAEDVALKGVGISSAFNGLSQADRQILSLLVFEQLSITEISVVLGISKNTTSKRIERARERFAQNLDADVSEN